MDSVDAYLKMFRNIGSRINDIIDTINNIIDNLQKDGYPLPLELTKKRAEIGLKLYCLNMSRMNAINDLKAIKNGNINFESWNRVTNSYSPMNNFTTELERDASRLKNELESRRNN